MFTLRQLSLIQEKKQPFYAEIDKKVDQDLCRDTHKEYLSKNVKKPVPSRSKKLCMAVYMALLVSNSLKSIIKSNDINKEIPVHQSMMMFYTESNK